MYSLPDCFRHSSLTDTPSHPFCYGAKIATMATSSSTTRAISSISTLDLSWRYLLEETSGLRQLHSNFPGKLQSWSTHPARANSSQCTTGTFSSCAFEATWLFGNTSIRLCLCLRSWPSRGCRASGGAGRWRIYTRGFIQR